jgi:hypothetical protein
MPEITFTTHSGFGNQMQSLLAAVLLANLTAHTLVTPPLLGHKKSFDIHRMASKSCPTNGAASSIVGTGRVDRRKHRYAHKVELHLRSMCNLQSSTMLLSDWTQFFAIDMICKVRPFRCSPPEALCPEVGADPHLGAYPARTECMGLPLSAAATLDLIHDATQSSPRNITCVGVLNDWFYTGAGSNGSFTPLLKRFEAFHALARELEAEGLPLAPKGRLYLDSVLPGTGRQCMCAYVRVPDSARGPKWLGGALANLQAESVRAFAYDNRARTHEPLRWLEVVSSCHPAEECEAITRNASLRLGLGLRPSSLEGPKTVSRRARMLEGLTKALGTTSIEDATILYDMYRCARCTIVKAVDALSPQMKRQPSAQSSASSFFQTIMRMHVRLAREAA